MNPVRAHCVLLAVAATAVALPSVAAQRGPTILKTEVDGLVRMLRHNAQPHGGLGDGSIEHTAMALTAAGHCHRTYYAGDGPWIRAALQSLFRQRAASGSFGEASAWVKDALRVMDPEGYATELARLGEDGEVPSPFGKVVQAVYAEVGDQPKPLAVVQARADRLLANTARGIPMQDGKPDIKAIPALLVELVACQVAARAGGRPPQAAAATADAPPAWLDSQQRGFDFLLTQQDGGAFFVEHGGQRFPDAGLTAIGLSALQTKPSALRTEAESAVIEQGLTWLLAQQNEQGGFGQSNINYTTCAAIMALAAADDARFAEALASAQKFVLFLQNIEERGYGRQDRDYGSIGYGGDERGDLSNLQFSIDALRRTELDAQHEAFQKALVFLQRVQNLKSVNDFRDRVPGDDGWYEVASGDDGGAAYYPGNSPAGYLELADGTRVPRSYGSMTYALLKAYILCGLPADDPRVRAAAGWITRHWTLEVNPGADPALGEKTAYQGLYYYYMVMAQALSLAGIDEVAPDEAAPVQWRDALAEHLAALQRGDGSWLNERNGRWWEDQPMVCTAYAMLALEHCAR